MLFRVFLIVQGMSRRAWMSGLIAKVEIFITSILQLWRVVRKVPFHRAPQPLHHQAPLLLLALTFRKSAIGAGVMQQTLSLSALGLVQVCQLGQIQLVTFHRKGESGEVNVTQKPLRALPRLRETDTMCRGTCQVGKSRGKEGPAPVRVLPMEQGPLNLQHHQVHRHRMVPLVLPLLPKRSQCPCLI